MSPHLYLFVDCHLDSDCKLSRAGSILLAAAALVLTVQIVQAAEQAGHCRLRTVPSLEEGISKPSSITLEVPCDKRLLETGRKTGNKEERGMGQPNGLLLQSKEDAISSNQRLFSFPLTLRELNFGRLGAQSLLSIAEKDSDRQESATVTH